MFSILPILIILFSLTGIVILVVTKFSQLSAINVNTIRQEKEKRVKKHILNERLKRRTEHLSKAMGSWTASITGKFSTAVKQTQRKLHDIEADMKKAKMSESVVSKADFKKQEEVIEKHLEEAQVLSSRDQFELAEKKYIDIIAADPRNEEAFVGLGDLYYEQGMLAEAKETFKHVLKLDPSSATAAYDLAHILKEEGDLTAARTYIRQSLAKEPKNVKYLDLDIELALELKDKLGAQESVAVVRSVNPDNKKLDSWEERLTAI